MLKKRLDLSDQHVYPDFANPYPYYEQIRKLNPVYRDDEGTWFLTRYEDVKLLFTDQRFSRRPPLDHGFVNQNVTRSALDEMINKWVLLNDPPQHTRLRQHLSTLINPRFMKDMREVIESTTDELLNSVLEHDQLDFMEKFAYPLPVIIVNKLLGSSLDIPTTRKWSLSIATALDHGSPEEMLAITPDVLDMQSYFTKIINEKEKAETNDWISDLVALKKSGDLSLDEAVSTCVFLMIAGHETVQLAVGNGLIAFIKNPEQRQLLQDNPELVTTAVEEILRYESPLNKFSRWTKEEIVINNITIPKNCLVVGMINAANRDPEKYAYPEKFDITRSNNRHLTFGLGIHNCLGALLARIELQIALTKLIPHLHKFSIIEDKWLSNSSFRYLFNLIVQIKH